MPASPAIQYRRVAIMLVLVGLLVAAAALDPVHDIFNQGLEAVKQIIRHNEILGLVVFVVLSAVSAIIFFFSTAVIVPVAIYTWGKPVTILLLWGSWLLGAVVSYSIGRRPGRRFAKWLVSGQRISKYEKKISAKTGFPLVLLFQLAVPSEIPGYVLGALRYHFGRYLGARSLAEIPFAVGAVYLGDSFMRQQYIPLLSIALGGIILSAVALYLFNKHLEH